MGSSGASSPPRALMDTIYSKVEYTNTSPTGCGRTSFQGDDEGGTAMAEQEDLRDIDALLEELRVIDPPEEFRRNAIVSDPEIYARAEADPEGFWAEQAATLRWSRRWDNAT